MTCSEISDVTLYWKSIGGPPTSKPSLDDVKAAMSAHILVIEQLNQFEILILFMILIFVKSTQFLSAPDFDKNVPPF